MNPPFVATHIFLDGEGMKFSRTTYHNAASHGAAVTEAVAVGSAMAQLSLCTYSAYAVAQEIGITSSLPAGTVDGEVQGLFTFLNDDGKVFQISIPGLDPGYKVPGTDLLDLLDADVIAFTGAMTGGTVVDSRNIDLESVKSGKEHFTKKRKSS